MAGGKVVVVAIDHSSQAEHAFKCEYQFSTNSWSVLVFLKFCKIVVSNRFCGICAR